MTAINDYFKTLGFNTDAPVRTTTRAVAVLDNTDTKTWLADYLSYEELPNWADDVIYGACGQMSGTTRINPTRIFRVLQTLDVISTETVAATMNRKREALGDKPYAKSTIEFYTRVLRCASQAIMHHKDFQVDQGIPSIKVREYQPLPYNSEEMSLIKHLSLKAPYAELKADRKSVV